MNSQEKIPPTSNESEDESEGDSSSVPRVFLSGEYVVKETGFWEAKLGKTQVLASEMDKHLSAGSDNRPPHVLDNRVYTPMAPESLRDRGHQQRKKSTQD